MSTPSAERDPVELLAEEFAERYRRGERPTVDEYTARFPQWAEQIRDLFPALVVMEQLKPSPAEMTGPFHAAAAGRHLPPIPERLGEYRILREIGRGGMGVVYEAVQESLGRHVALKVLPATGLVNATYLERFRREARAAASLQHPNIVTVFGTGAADGVHFYAMQFIAGQGLDQALRDLRKLRDPTESATPIPDASIACSLLTDAGEPLDAANGQTVATTGPVVGSGEATSHSPLVSSGPANASVPHSEASLPADYHRTAARIGVQVAEALAYAHAHGVQHRDIKPSNLLLDARLTVFVTDFGLAKAEGNEDLTGTGDIIGTLRFMAPERFNGESLPQGDLYSLGLTLYELLTLRPAFEDASKGRLIDRILHDSPVPPRRIDRSIPRDLETIVLKCLARDPDERYRTATDLAGDLRAFLDDRPIRARRSSWAEDGWRWCRRNPVVAGLSLAVVLLALLLFIQLRGKPPRPGEPGSSADTPLGDPGTLTAFQHRDGTALFIQVTGNPSGPIWGTNVYTSDTSLSRAVIHAGILRQGERGVVQVTILPGQNQYTGSLRHGISSSSYGQWSGSYRIDAVGKRAAPARTLTPGKLPPSQQVLPDPGMLTEYRGHEIPLFFNVIGSTGGSVWGTDVYTDDSHLATAAVHAGALAPDQSGIVKVTLLPREQSYPGMIRNGVRTSDWGGFQGSFKVEAVVR